MSKTKAQPQQPPKSVQPGKKPAGVWSADRSAKLRQGARARAGLDCNCACDCACACK